MVEIVVVGAGNIGRGLLGEVAAREGWGLTFVEAVRAHAARLRDAGAYRVHLSGAVTETVSVAGYGVIEPAGDPAGRPRDEALLAGAVKRAAASGGFLAVAVGPQNLAAAARSLAPALARAASGSDARSGGPIPILVCENKRTAAHELASELVGAGLSRGAFATIATSVERMVRPDPDSLDLYAEAGQTLFVDRRAWEDATARRGARLAGPPVAAPAAFHLTDDLDAYYARKLFTNNAGHALLAYLGHLRGHRTIAQAVADPALSGPLRELLDAAAQMLARDYDLDPARLATHARALLEVRFPNVALADPVARVARDPIRKLGPTERLAGLLRRLEHHGLPTDSVCRTIAAALHYRAAGDAESEELARRIRENGPGAVLRETCGIGPDEPAYITIMRWYEEENHEERTNLPRLRGDRSDP